MTLKFEGWPWKTPFLCYFKLCASFRSHRWLQTEVTVWKRPIRLKIGDFVSQCDLKIWQMTLKTNGAPFLTYFKLYASFNSHWWIQTGVTVRRRPTWVKIGDFWSPVTLKFDTRPWKTIGHLFYATSSYVHHFIAICELELKLRSGKAQIGARFALTSVTLIFDLWPWSIVQTSRLSMVITI